MARKEWFGTQVGKTTVTILVGLALVGLGLSLPWPAAPPHASSLTVRVGTSSASYNWSSFQNWSPSYFFPTSYASTNFSAVSGSQDSNLTLWVRPSLVNPGADDMMLGFFETNVTGAIAPDIHPSAVRLVVSEWSGTTYPMEGLIQLWQYANTSNPVLSYPGTGQNFEFGGPGSGSVQLDLENESVGPSSAPTYHFWFNSELQLQGSLPTSSGVLTLSIFAILVGTSQLVYTAITLQFVTVFR